MSVVETAMFSTTPNAFAAPPDSSRTAATMNAVAITPESMFARSGVPSF